MQIKNVTGNDQGTDKSHQPVILEMVNPTDRASMEVATPLNEKGLGTNSWNFIILIGSRIPADQHGASDIAKKDQRKSME